MILRLCATLVFFLSSILLPWYVPVFLGGLLIALWGGYVEVIIGGIIMDTLFGTSIPLLYGFAYLYTALFVALSLMAMVLRRMMIE